MEKGVPAEEARDEGKLAYWMAKQLRVERKRVKQGSMMGGYVPLAKVATRRKDRGFNSYRVFVIRGYRFFATLTWHDETEADLKLARELGQTFQLIDIQNPLPGNQMPPVRL